MPPAGNPFQHWRRIITGLRAEETKLESICFEHAGEAPDAVFGGKGAHSPEREESSSGEADALSFYYQKQTRRHNRQIHKLSILKGGVRKRNQAPYEVKGFRLFDKVACKGETAFIFGRRSTGSFDVRRLDGTRISAGISFKKLRLLERRRTYLTELRKEAALPPLPEGRGLRADF